MSEHEFGSLNLEDVANEDARLSNEGGQNNFLDQFVPMPDVKPGQTGSVTLRILPPIKGGKLFQYNRVHSINGRKVHCPRPLSNGKWDRNVPCPVCDYYSSLWRKADQAVKEGRMDDAERLKDEARALKPVERYYYNAIVRSLTVDGETKKNVGPRILSIGKILHSMIVRAIMGDPADPDSKLGNITDPKNGYDFIIRKEVTPGEGFPKYDRSGFARNTSVLGEPGEISEWATNLHDLTKLRNPPEVDKLEKELAIHRHLIPDDDTSFNTDNFDAKWRQNNQDGMDEVVAAVTPPKTPKPTAASVTEPVVSQSSTPVADAPIEDEEFLKELADME
jgi:hypothetical protein